MTQWTIACQAPWDSPGKNTGVGCYALLQGIFPTQDQTCISCIAGGVFTAELPRKSQYLLLNLHKSIESSHHAPDPWILPPSSPRNQVPLSQAPRKSLPSLPLTEGKVLSHKVESVPTPCKSFLPLLLHLNVKSLSLPPAAANFPQSSGFVMVMVGVTEDTEEINCKSITEEQSR